MIKRQKLAALILSRRDSGEADRRLTLLTREYGLMRVTAKGVRRIPSRRGGHCEPFTHILAIISGSPHHRYLAASETIDTFPRLQRDASATDHMQSISQLLLNTLGDEQPETQLYDALLDTCHMLPTLPRSKQRLAEIAITLLTLHDVGILPDFSVCTVCRKKPGDDAVVLRGDRGGWHCLSCSRSFTETKSSFPARLLKAVRWISKHPHAALKLRLTDSESDQLLTAVRDYISQIEPRQATNLESTYAVRSIT